MRLYSFGNMYLQGIQAGIQCQHCTVELFNKYPMPAQWDVNPERDDFTTKVLHEWAKDHKTTILLNGGNQRGLQEIMRHFDKPENPYPYEDFVEDFDALNGALTNVSIVLPEEIYKYKKRSEEVHAEISKDGRTLSVWREGDFPNFSPGFVEYRYTDWELELIQIINSKRLMS